MVAVVVAVVAVLDWVVVCVDDAVELADAVAVELRECDCELVAVVVAVLVREDVAVDVSDVVAVELKVDVAVVVNEDKWQPLKFPSVLCSTAWFKRPTAVLHAAPLSNLMALKKQVAG